ncbi:mitochondrial import inner membrane translocase subunit Tim29-like [Hydractinia symbiolongicarpus]|uniref:mitochondrial import inner membrane translocase subunit Tim29-like n=1 Tax=Hydractinia symbiolongicarpus TaxID=13093 RepID=UPI0025518A09|nr:mitochondrial import inner membrane translocase subunit Tim29-like [Hydractinia symbiolongicarpus]
MSAGAWKSAKNINRKLFPQFESLRQGRLAKVFDLYRDYKQAFVDIYKHVKEKPVKVGLQLSMLGFATYCHLHNPDLESYKERLLAASNDHSLLSDLIRNKNSISSLKTLMKYYSEDRFKRVNFGVASVIMLQPHSHYYDSYEKHCPDTQARWIYVHDWKSRILDIGVLNRWLFLDNIMVDYDVNQEEFE